MQRITLFCVLFFSMLFVSCINNVEDQTGANDDINPEDISYASHVQPIFNSSCGGGSCHISNTTNGVNLSSHQNTTNSVGLNYGKNIVIAGEPDESPIIDKIEPNPELGTRMPQTGSLLSASQIDTIRAWIEGGALNN